jgi:hypothetical protein
MDAFILCAINGTVKQVPKDESKEVFVGSQFEVAVDLVDDNGLPAYGARQETSH